MSSFIIISITSEQTAFLLRKKPELTDECFFFSIRFIEPGSLLSSAPPQLPTKVTPETDQPPPGTVKSIIPCTPLAIVKCLEYAGVYNTILPYGDRAYGRIVTVINRFVYSGSSFTSPTYPFASSEVVGRPLAALLSNDGARVFSVDIDSIQVLFHPRIGSE